MSDTRVCPLTPPGVAAIAVVEVSGPRAWEFARRLFRPAGRSTLPDRPPVRRFWFGRFGGDRLSPGDEVVLACTGPQTVEVHCHGGRRVVRWVVDCFRALGCVETAAVRPGSLPDLLARAPTLRTAAVLLDQLQGAFDRAARYVLQTGDRRALTELARYAPVGRHLIEPWRVVIAGRPNVGKSTLVNALAGYQRSVVSDVPGTTRDVVTVPLAFDGWPVELTDTAGLRDAEGLEAEGIARARRVLATADLVIWLRDATRPEDDPRPPEPARPTLAVWNKCDQVSEPPPGGDVAIAAATGTGVPELVAAIVRRLVPDPPPPGSPVPYTPELAQRVEAAAAADPDTAADLLRACLTTDPLIQLTPCLSAETV